MRKLTTPVTAASISRARRTSTLPKIGKFVSRGAGFAAILFSAFLGSQVLADPIPAPTIDTTQLWNGTSSIGPMMGAPGHASAFGQTVLVGADNVLDSFSFFLSGFGPFTGYVMEWSGDRVAGTVLYQSPLRQLIGGEYYVFDTGGVALTEGRTYLLFVDAGDDPSTMFQAGITGGTDVYSSGEYFGSAYGADFDAFSTTAWDRLLYPEGGVDAAFTARFSSIGVPDISVPEPSSLSLLLGSLFLLRLSWRARNKRGPTFASASELASIDFHPCSAAAVPLH